MGSPGVRPFVERGSAFVQDLRLLGFGAPVRAGLELSKRLGGHGVVFGRLARQEADPSERTELTWTDPFPVLDPAALARIHPTVRDRTLHEAGAIASGIIELFGQRLDLGPDPDWHAAIDDPGRWPLEPWWEIDIRSAARLGDVKWVWELGRHRHLVVLARATALDPGNDRWIDTLNRQLDSWLTANPAELGVHWYSNLEIALRAVAWCEILGLAGPSLRPATRSEMVHALHHSGRHLLADLPYTVSTMRNNHLLGDALGLLVLGQAFAGHSRARRWRTVGGRLYDRQLRRQVHADGAQIEDSVSYHRFVLEMLLARLRLGDAGPDVRRATRSSAELLARLGVFEGPVPRYGDGDEGRVLASTAPFTDLAGSTVAALLAAGGTLPAAAADATPEHDEVAWYPLPRPATPATPPTALARADGGGDRGHGEDRIRISTSFPIGAGPRGADGSDGAASHAELVGGGIVRARIGPVAVWLKAGGDTSHGHADLCSTVIAWHEVADGATATGATPAGATPAGAPPADAPTSSPPDEAAWLVGDPGTGTYNGPVAERDYFRSTLAHSALRLADEDQLVPYRAFRWRYTPVGAAAEPIAVGDARVLWGWHGAYLRLDPPRRVVRAVALQPRPGGARVTVIDWIEGPAGIDYALSLPLGPQTTWADGALVTGLGSRAPLTLPAAPTEHRGVTRPFDGWWSPSYGAHVPSTRLEVRGTVDGPVVWQLAAAPSGADTAAASSGAASDATTVDGSTVRLSPALEVAARFEDDGVRLVTPAGDAVLPT